MKTQEDAWFPAGKDIIPLPLFFHWVSQTGASLIPKMGAMVKGHVPFKSWGLVKVFYVTEPVNLYSLESRTLIPSFVSLPCHEMSITSSCLGTLPINNGPTSTGTRTFQL